MSVGPVNQPDVDIDLGRLFKAVWERKLLVAGLTAAAAGLAFIITGMINPLYKSEARLLIETREPVYSSDQNRTGSDAAMLDERAVTSQVEILRSTDLVKQVARELDLSSREEFDSAANTSAIGNLLVLVGMKKDPLLVPADERVLKEFYKKLEVYAVPGSRVIAIEFSSEDPDIAAQVPNALIDAYLTSQSGAKLENNTDASAWLEPEITKLRQKVRESEEKIAQYRSETGLLLVNQQDTIAAKQLSDISTELSRVRAERADSEARAQSVRNALKSGQSVDAISDVLGSALVQRLRESEGSVRAQLADLSTTLLEAHPRMKGLRAQLADIERQILAEIRKVLSSLESNARVAKIREEELTAQLNELKAGSAREGEEAVELRSLEREAAAQRDLLETYLGRYREAASRTEPKALPADARVISRAVPASESHYPKKGPIIIVAAFATLLLSTVGIMLGELFSGRALRPSTPMLRDEAYQAEAEPVVAAAVPVSPNADIEAGTAALPIIANEADDFTVEAVAEQLVTDQVSVAVCVSPEGDEGSATSVMLARTIAGEGLQTLLIDLTGSACPTELMAESLRLPGLTDLMCGEIAIADSIHPDRLSSAHIIPRGNANARRAMRAIDRLPMVIDALTEAYDIVIVECGAADAAAIARIARADTGEIVLSILHADEAAVKTLLADFHEHGFEDVLLMTPGEPLSPLGNRSSAA
ncbi:Wzz/FepE/Etk N-terminal domain-containing protein [Hoeflea sp. G2-23]|uniref:Wzz/FepE/Etk N-terminal domain-containing protein n=1 Tax=Hoeflea algicola TaxID=2983763 RepID=A0ABT3Z4B7_9HYPH|nr:Wzz/FepE/Etk N-terminal domain-containing protein [Hoeflea algicola]MCY0146493.1 Wzz/FepE/Etk N-terminal domain-containing protein [Hoeflea algicola]